MWTHFYDMHSGGTQKETFAHCFIQESEEIACQVFYNRFGHNPHRVTCTCCGPDYNIYEERSLDEATKYYRTRTEQTLSAYVNNKDVLIIRWHDITTADRAGELPQQGYVWAGN
jgi:hypothetical protein